MGLCGDMLEIVSNQLRNNIDQLTWDIEKTSYKKSPGDMLEIFKKWDLHISNNQEPWIQMRKTASQNFIEPFHMEMIGRIFSKPSPFKTNTNQYFLHQR